MLTGFVRNFVSFKAQSVFEKARLSATYKGDNDPPNEVDIQAILLTLSGKDEETRPQIAFTTILQKLESSQSKNYWNYLMKNLIILDRLERNIQTYLDVWTNDFSSKILQPYIQIMQNSIRKQILYIVILYLQLMNFQAMFQIDMFLRLYFRYIKVKALMYSRKSTSFNMSREEVKVYFQASSADQIFEEVGLAQKLHEVILELTNTDKRGLLRFQVNQYIFLLLLYTLTNLYSTQYMAILSLVEKLFKIDLRQSQQFKIMYTRFLKQNEELIQFINTHKYIKGYDDIKISDFNRNDTRIVAAIDDYIQIQTIQQTVGLPDEIIIEDEQLVFEEISPNQGKSVKTNKDEPKMETQQSKCNKQFPKIILQKNNFPYESHIPRLKEGLFETFDSFTFEHYVNNFSNDYSRIDPLIYDRKTIMSQESSSPQKRSLLNRWNNDFTVDKAQQLQFQKVDLFDELVFKCFKNKFCFTDLVPIIVLPVETKKSPIKIPVNRMSADSNSQVLNEDAFADFEEYPDDDG